MDSQRILETIQQAVRPYVGQGRVADYIPALARVPADTFGMAVRTVEGETFSVGDAAAAFSIQSISKVFTLTMALQFEGDALWKRLGREPSGNPFNSLVQLEYENGIPRNPFINAGALVLADVILSHTSDAKAAILDFVRTLCARLDVHYNLDVARSEREWGDPAVFRLLSDNGVDFPVSY